MIITVATLTLSLISGGDNMDIKLKQGIITLDVLKLDVINLVINMSQMLNLVINLSPMLENLLSIEFLLRPPHQLHQAKQ
jgi:hypothetical protein